MKALWFTLVLLAIGYESMAQENDLEFFLVEGSNGKPLGKIRNITQDPRGYMWFAGEDKGSEGSGVGCIYKFDGNKMTLYKHDSANPNSLGGAGVNSVFADDAGMIWIGISDAGLDQFNPVTSIFKHFQHAENDPGSISGDVTPVLKDHHGRLWVGTNNGLDQLDEKTGKFIHYRHDPKDPKSLSSNFIWNLYEDHEGVLWVATGFPWNNQDPEDGGLNRMELDGTFTRFKHDPNDLHSLISNKVRSMFEDSRGVFWVGTSGDGLHTMDRKTGRFERHSYDPAKPDKLSRPPRNTTSEFAYINDQVTFIQEDVIGSIWIGTMQSGLNRYDTLTKRITHYQGNNGFPDSSGWNCYQSRDGVLWITTEEANLYRVDPFRQRINHAKVERNGRRGGTRSILEDKNGNLWVGRRDGLLKFDRQKRLVHKFENDPSDPKSLSDNGVNFVFQEQQDTLWICTSRGIDILDLRTEKFSRFHPTEMFASLDTSRVSYILNDSIGLKWISTWGNGLFRYDANSKDVKHYIPDPKDSGSIGTKDLLQIHKDKSGTLWFGSWDGGLNRLDPEADQFRHYLGGDYVYSFYEDKELFLVGTDKGLYRYNKTNDSFSVFDGSEELAIINGMIEDDEGNLWIATNSRIVKINKNRSQLFLYGSKFGIGTNNLTPGPNMVKIKNGQILKGTFDGFHYFSPAELALKSLPTQILISDFSVNSLSVLNAKEGALLKPIEDVSKITLSYDQNNFSFTFGSDDYRTPHGVRYYTMLENYDKTWREALGDKSTSYFYVNPGDYVFKIMIYNNDGVKLIKTLDLRVDPPWWRTTWAYSIYGALFILLVYVLFNLQKTRIIRTERLKTQAKELEQAKEIEKAYIDLKSTQAQLIQSEKMASLGELTVGIAHEIQNPLNFINNFSELNKELITEMSDEIENGNYSNVKLLSKDINDNQEKITHHGKRADSIVKGMLQHSRSSSGVMEPTDINKLTDEYTRMAYHGYKAKNNSCNVKIDTSFDPTIGPVKIIPQDIGRVILNLINNALYVVTEKKKISGDNYEPTIKVTSKKTHEKILITVSDNGNGIRQEILDKIFQPFFTTKPTGQGTGLGLSLSYDIVKAHGGEIKIVSNEARPDDSVGRGQGAEFIIQLPLHLS